MAEIRRWYIVSRETDEIITFVDTDDYKDIETKPEYKIVAEPSATALDEFFEGWLA